MKKKLLAFIISAVVAVICIPFTAGVTVFAGVDDYPAKYKNAEQDSITDEWYFYNRECTSFVAWRLNSRNGVAFNNSYGGVHWGNASNWGNAARSAGIAVDMNPAVGSVYWEAGGHVAWVEAVNGNNVTIEEYNWGNPPGNYHEQTLDKNRASGYIHIKDISVEGHTMTEKEAAGQTIPDGDYWIYNALHIDYFVDVVGTDIVTSPTNVVMYRHESHKIAPSYDTFTIKYLNNGFYKITQRGSDMCLEVEGASLKAGSNVRMYKDNGTAAQQWSIKKTLNGYVIQSRCNSFCLDVLNGKVENNTNVQVWNEHNDKAHYFGFIPYIPDEQPIEDGIYNISTACNSKYYIDSVGAPGEYKAYDNVQIYEGKTDKYEVKYAGYGWYKIHEISSGLALDVATNGSNIYLDHSLNVQLYKDSTSRAQYWKIHKTSDGYYNIIAKSNGYYLDLNDAKAVNCSNISAVMYNGSAAQKWNFEKVEDIETPTTATTETPVTTTVTTTTITTVKPTLTGDTNGNGSVNSADMVMLQQYITKKDTLTNSANADINGDGKIDVFDAVLLRRMILKI